MVKIGSKVGQTQLPTVKARVKGAVRDAAEAVIAARDGCRNMRNTVATFQNVGSRVGSRAGQRVLCNMLLRHLMPHSMDAATCVAWRPRVRKGLGALCTESPVHVAVFSLVVTYTLQPYTGEAYGLLGIVRHGITIAHDAPATRCQLGQQPADKANCRRRITFHPVPVQEDV